MFLYHTLWHIVIWAMIGIVLKVFCVAYYLFCQSSALNSKKKKLTAVLTVAFSRYIQSESNTPVPPLLIPHP